jgi:hypothetical protein
MQEKEFSSKFKERFSFYKHSEKAQEWLNENIDRVKSLFKDVRLRDFIFEPFKDVFKETDDTNEGKIKSIITLVAVVNMVLAGLPGKLLGGVFVCIALEAYMAYKIAQNVGIKKIRSVHDIWKYLGLLGGISFVILEGFRQMLGLAFSMFSVIPGINPLIFAELFVTDLVGVLFWVGFVELRDNDNFTIPVKLLKSIFEKALDLFKHQKNLLINTLTISNLKKVGVRLKAWLTGEIIIDQTSLRGEIFPFVAMSYLIQGKYESLDGPLGNVFINAIRRGYSNKLGDASLEEMSEYFSGAKGESLKGHINLITGEMREKLGEIAENIDGDEFYMKLHADRTVKGSDAVMINSETGEEILISFKSTSDPALIETALRKYPEYPIVTTTEMEELYGDHPLVMFDGISDKDLKQVTEENFEKLSGMLEKASVGEIVATGVSVKAIASLYPFMMAYLRKRISQEQLNEAFEKVLGKAGVELASRLAWGFIFGTVFAWYLLARGVIMIMQGAENQSMKNPKIVILN